MVTRYVYSTNIPCIVYITLPLCICWNRKTFLWRLTRLFSKKRFLDILGEFYVLTPYVTMCRYTSHDLSIRQTSKAEISLPKVHE